MNVRPMPFVVVLVAVVALAAGCASAAAEPTPVAPTIAVDADHVIELDLTGDLKILRDGQPVSTISVRQGETYTFRVANTAGYDHDFHIATDEVLSAGGHGHPGLEPWNKGTLEFQYTFDSPGPLAFGCTIAGHYQSMKGTFDIQP